MTSVSIIVLSQNPGTSDVYIEHSVQATVARYAPSGFYIASGGMHTIKNNFFLYVHVRICMYLYVITDMRYMYIQ